MTDYRTLARALIDKSERDILTGYLDQGKVPTWGRGHTGPEVQVGVTISQEHSDIDLDNDLAKHDAALRQHVPPEPFSRMTEHEKAALLDFVFNTGGGPFDKDEWNIWRVVRSGALAQVPAELNRFIYVHIDGVAKTSAGLKNRRSAEIVMWNTGDIDAAAAAANAGGNAVSSAAIRELPTPPVSGSPKALAKTSLGVKVATAISGAGAFIAQAVPGLGDHAQRLHDIVSQHSDMPYAGPVASTLAAIVVGCGVAALFIHDAQQKAAKV